MLKFRQQSEGLKTGKTYFFETEEPVLAFSRKSKNENAICIFNLSKEKVSILKRAPREVLLESYAVERHPLKLFYAIDNKASDCSHRIKQTSQAPESSLKQFASLRSVKKEPADILKKVHFYKEESTNPSSSNISWSIFRS